jgi:hypothetical protein
VNYGQRDLTEQKTLISPMEYTVYLVNIYVFQYSYNQLAESERRKKKKKIITHKHNTKMTKSIFFIIIITSPLRNEKLFKRLLALLFYIFNKEMRKEQ